MDAKDLMAMGPPSIQQKDGKFYTWIPKPTNPSKVICHEWDGANDRWIERCGARCLPSKSWGSL